MLYIVRTVSWSEERRTNVEELRRAIPRLEVIVDHRQDWYGTFFEACARLDATGGVLLEDDVQLCRRFPERIEAVIRERGSDEVINFFEKPRVDLPTAYVGGSQFLWMQCLYLPPGLPGRMPGYYEAFRRERPRQHRGLSVDAFVSYVLVRERRKYWRIRPCLVQHRNFKSLGGHAAGRQTPFFIDDLEAPDAD